MEIAVLDVDDVATMTELFDLADRATAADQPGNRRECRVAISLLLREGHPSGRMECHLARVDGRLAGFATIGFPLYDNLHLAQIGGMVAPEHRHRGVGGALLNRVHERCRAEARTTLITHVNTQLDGGPFRSPDAPAFLARHGFDLANRETCRRLELSTVDEEAEEKLLAECRPYAGGYETFTWTGATPDEVIDGVAALNSRIMLDVPSGDLELEQRVYDVEKVRAEDEFWLRAGRASVYTVARHRETGEIAALTHIAVTATSPDHADQQITIVDPAHRGRRLGTVVKIENQRALRRECPEVRRIDTSNADVNAHMIAINDALGFVPVAHLDTFQKALAQDLGKAA